MAEEKHPLCRACGLRHEVHPPAVILGVSVIVCPMVPRGQIFVLEDAAGVHLASDRDPDAFSTDDRAWVEDGLREHWPEVFDGPEALRPT